MTMQAVRNHEGNGAIESASTIFGLLGNRTRLAMLVRMLELGRMTVAEICEFVGCSDTNVHALLRPLRTTGLVTTDRDGRLIYYRLVSEYVSNLLQGVSKLNKSAA